MKREYKKEHSITEHIKSKGYQTCEYIECSGSQYILPNVVLNSKDVIECFMSMKIKVSSTEQNYVSLYDNTGYYAYCPTIAYYGSNSGTTYLDVQVANIGGGGYSDVLNFNDRVNFLVTFNQQNGTYLDIKNQASKRCQVLHYIPTNSRVQLLAAQVVSANKRAQCKLYKCEITKNDEMVRDLYPVYKISTGVSGLYDMVSDSFYGNNGSGSFTHGTDIEI